MEEKCIYSTVKMIRGGATINIFNNVKFTGIDLETWKTIYLKVISDAMRSKGFTVITNNEDGDINLHLQGTYIPCTVECHPIFGDTECKTLSVNNLIDFFNGL